MKKNKKITWALALLVFVIWGFIGYQLIDSFSGPSSDIAAQSNQSYAKQAGQPFVYRDDVRDPFQFPKPVKKPSPKPETKNILKEQWEPPSYTLGGVITNKKKKTAILLAADGMAFFLTEGDTLGGVKILKVKDRTVTYLYQKQKAEWKLEESAQ